MSAVSQHIDDLVIARQFCGPPSSGNGGYVCGRLAAYVDGPATVRLMRPPPLEVPLAVIATAEGVELRNGDEVVAMAWPAVPAIEIPQAPNLEAARHGRENFPGHTRHAFPGCFVCGVAREEGDGLLIHAGPYESADRHEQTAPGVAAHHVACDWSPHESLCDDGGVVANHFIWAALDCPSGWAFLAFCDDIAVLGEFTAEILSPAYCGQEYILAGWESARQGRKCKTGSALYDSEGNALARAEATWIVIDPPAQ